MEFRKARASAHNRPDPPGDGEPLYLAVYGSLRKSLQNGVWPVGSSLPSEAELSGRFSVSRITVRHALRLLEEEGYIRKARARRPVVISTTPTTRPGWMVESLEDIVAMVGDARLEVESWRRESASTEAKQFGLPSSTRLHCLRSVLVRDGRPYSRSIIYFPPAVGSQLSRQAFDDAIVFRVLQRETGLRLDDVRLTIWAELAAPEDAASLHCEIGAALLVMQLHYRDEGGTLVEIAYGR
jgi:GntR family transcriptional regulator